MIKRFIKNTFLLYWELLLLFGLIYWGIYDVRFMFAAFLINVVTIVFGNFKLGFAQLFFLLPFSMIYKLSPESSSFFAYGMLVMSVVALSKTITKTASIYVLIFLYTLYLFAGLTANWSMVIKAIGGLICLVYFVKSTKVSDIRDIILSSSLGILGASYMGLSKLTNPNIHQFFTDDNSEYMNGERIFRFSGLMPDPNYYSVSVIVVVFMLIRLVQSKVINKYFGSGLILTLIWFGALSYSRIYFISLFFLVLYYVHLYTGKSRYGLLSLIGVSITSIFAWLYFTNTSYYLNAISRFEVDDVSNGRTSLWVQYIKIILDDVKILLLGSGYDSKLVGGHGAHNTYIEAIYHIGCIGLLLLLTLFRSIFRLRGPFNGKWPKGQRWEQYVLLMIFCVMIGTLGFYKQNDFPFYLMMVWVSMYYTPFELTKAYSYK